MYTKIYFLEIHYRGLLNYLHQINYRGLITLLKIVDIQPAMFIQGIIQARELIELHSLATAKKVSFQFAVWKKPVKGNSRVYFASCLQRLQKQLWAVACAETFFSISKTFAVVTLFRFQVYLIFYSFSLEKYNFSVYFN